MVGVRPRRSELVVIEKAVLSKLDVEEDDVPGLEDCRVIQIRQSTRSNRAARLSRKICINCDPGITILKSQFWRSRQGDG